MSALKKLTRHQSNILQQMWKGQFIICAMGECGRAYQLAGGETVSKTTFDALWRAGFLIAGNDGLDASTAQTYRAKAMTEMPA